MSKYKQVQRHVRWNWEESPDNEYDGKSVVRYHVVDVDDKYRKLTLERIFEQLTEVRGGIEIIRTKEGKVRGTPYRYLFKSFDSSVSPNIIDWSKVKKRVKRYLSLRERKLGSEGIEKYVARKYE